MPMTKGSHTANTLLAFMAGVLAFLLFHQIASSLVNGRVAWNISTRIAPFGIPQVFNQAFWGGIWGIVFALAAPKFPRGLLWWVAALAFGAVLLPLVSWYVVPAIKGAALGPRNSIMNSMIVNGAWGVGMGVFWKLFGARAP